MKKFHIHFNQIENLLVHPLPKEAKLRKLVVSKKEFGERKEKDK